MTTNPSITASELRRLSKDICELYIASAEVYRAAEYEAPTRHDVHLNSLRQQREQIAARNNLLVDFERAYYAALEGDVIREGQFSYWQPKNEDSQCRVEPLPYQYAGYHQKALAEIDELLTFASGDGGERPYILDMESKKLANECKDHLQKEANNAALGAAEAPKEQGDDWLTHIQIAERYGLDCERVRQKLNRWRKKHLDDFKQLTERGPHGSIFEYRLAAVRHLFEQK